MALCDACLVGDISLVNLTIEEGATNFNDELFGACYGGHSEIILYLIEKGATNFNDFEIGKQMKKRFDNLLDIDY